MTVITISANLLNLIILAMEAGYTAIELKTAIAELQAMSDEERDAAFKQAEIARQAERDRRAKHKDVVEPT
jgi:hypothetical protein